MSIDTPPRARGTRGRNSAPAPVVPRHNLDAEAAVLGAMLLHPDAIVTAGEVLRASDFYRPAHSTVFSAITALFNRGAPVDALTTHAELIASHVGDIVTLPDLTALMMDTPSAQHAGTYAAIVRDAARLRALDTAATEVRALANEAASADDAIDRAEGIIFSVSNDARSTPVKTATDHAHAMRANADDAEANPGMMRGLSVGFRDIDVYLRGLQRGKFIIVGARPSIGKTAFGLTIALANARAGVGVLFCSLEMDHDEIVMRLGSMMSGIDADLVSSGRMSDAQHEAWDRAADELAQLPLWIDDDAGLDLFRLKARARRLQREGLGLVIIDYLQLIATPEAENRQVEVSKLSRGLKLSAKSLGIPIVTMSQLSRNLETRLNKTPVLADLRESGSLEQDADVVMLLSRDLEPGSPRRAILEVHIAKNRSGRVGKIDLAWRAHITALAPLVKEPFNETL